MKDAQISASISLLACAIKFILMFKEMKKIISLI
jgi:hypothetical protein